MNRYIKMLSPVTGFFKRCYAPLKRYYYVSLPVAACVALLLIVRPWSIRADGQGGAFGTSSAKGGGLLVADRAPAGADPISYEFIMTERQQKRMLADAPKLKVGDDVNDVLKRLGSPFRDDGSYGRKEATEPAKGRALSYYFGKRQIPVGNDFDPLVYIVFDENGKLFAMASNVAEIPELNWGTGFTAYHGINR